MKISNEIKRKIVKGLQLARENYDGSDAAFAKRFGISSSIFSRLKKGEIEGLIGGSNWLTLARELGVSLQERKWETAETDVFKMIQEDILFCKEYSKSRICVDDCGIGKTWTARILSRTLKNCFYVDASQAKTKQLFIRLIAKTIGVDHTEKYAIVKENLKYYIKMLPLPIIIVDEAGDLEYPAFLELKELWNATENYCGWYLIGAEGLRSKIDKGIRSKRVGYKEIFSRYSDSYTQIVPTGREDRQAFYRRMITQVLSVNMPENNSPLLNEIVKRCITTDSAGQIGGLRRAESLLILNQES